MRKARSAKAKITSKKSPRKVARKTISSPKIFGVLAIAIGGYWFAKTTKVGVNYDA